MMSYHVLCIDDDAEFLLTLKIQLKKNYKVFTAQNLKEGQNHLEEQSIDLILLDVRLGEEDGLVGLKSIREKFPDVDVVMVSGQKDPKLIVKAIQEGASDYICKPFSQDELLAVVEKTKKLRSMRERHDAYVMEQNQSHSDRPLIGNSRTFKKLLEQVQCVRGHQANVLIEGESGTGKELLARYIHELEVNPNRPFIAVNCAAIPETLIESELFGHEKGAFSGAYQRKVGKFELAHGGDIFLDEINSLKPDMQAKILRVLQEKEVYRVGGNTPIKINFRVIAATNSNLDRLVQKQSFRMDLLFRLRVVSFRIPSLRERIEDIPNLVEYFLAKHSPVMRKMVSSEVMEKLCQYAWPGNVRELENLIHSLIIMTRDEEIALEDLPKWVYNKNSQFQLPTQEQIQDLDEVVPLKHYLQKTERNYVKRVLNLKQGDKSKTAEILGISRTSLYEKIKNLT